MKRFLGWLFMVLLFTVLVVGGAIGFFYWQAGEGQLPAKDVALDGQPLGEPAGYSWEIPVLGGVLWRPVQRSPGLAATQLPAPITIASPALTLAEGMSEAGTRLWLKDGAGATVFEGTAAQWKSFAFTQNGSYTLTLQAGRQKSVNPPAQPAGYYQYQCRFEVDVKPTLTLSEKSVPQGQTAAIYLSGVLGSGTAAPSAQCDLGPVWFHQTETGWVGYLPVTYNAQSGDYTVTVSFGEETLTATLSVYGKEWPRVTVSEAAGGSSADNEQFRNAIWGFYNQGSGDALWNGAFRTPVEGNTGTLQPYGAYLFTGDNQAAGRATGITYLCEAGSRVVSPAPGRVVLAKQLALTGGTVVIDHGCGVKSYLFGLESLGGLAPGDGVTQGDELGIAAAKLTWEVRIGNKSIDPLPLTQHNGGLFFVPRQ